MKLDKSLEPFRAAIDSLQRLLRKFDDRGVIIGGIAVGFLGKPRFTANGGCPLRQRRFAERSA